MRIYVTVSENSLVHLFILLLLLLIFFIQDIYYSNYKELITKKAGAIAECGLFYKELINT